MDWKERNSSKGQQFNIANYTVDFGNVSNSFNATSPENSGSSPLQVAAKIVLMLVLLVIMFSVGCQIDVKDLFAHLRRPFGIVIGAVAQFVLLPLLAFGAGHALQLPPLQALGMLVMSCCPGGSTSNIFTYWVDGDVPLSVSMTTINTALAAGMLPLNLWIYGGSWSATTAAIPYRNIAEAFALVVFPAAAGILLRWKRAKLAAVLIKVGSVCAALSIVLTEALMFALYPRMFFVTWRIYVAVILLPTVAYVLGYVFAWIVRMESPQRRTVSMETAVQNFPLCMTLLALSYPKEQLGEIAIYPLLFGCFILVESILFVAGFRLKEWINRRSQKGVEGKQRVVLLNGDCQKKEEKEKADSIEKEKETWKMENEKDNVTVYAQKDRMNTVSTEKEKGFQSRLY